MKSTIFAFLLLVGLSASAQKTHHFGISFGAVSNSSVFVSGMEQANGLFSHNDHGAGFISFSFEKELNEHFSLETALSFTELGFTYSLEKDYSLRNPLDKYQELASGNCIGQIPLFLNYKTKLNCMNNRWFIGAGPQLMYSTSDFSSSGNTEVTREGVTVPDKMHATSSMDAFATFSLAGQMGIEHVFKKGSRLRWSVILNHGFSELGFSTVNYTVNNQEYSHTFGNNGSYGGCTVSWFFK